MDFEKLLNPIAEYFDFVIDFVAFQGFVPYVRLGSVSPRLVSFLFIGMIFGFVIKRAKAIPSFGEDVRFANFLNPKGNPMAAQSTQPEQSLVMQTPEMLLMVIFQISGAIFMHLALLIASSFNHLDMGNFKDSLNVTIAVSSVQYPLVATMSRLFTFMKKIQDFNRKTKIIAAFVYIGGLVVVIAPAFYFFNALCVVHSLPWRSLIAPSALTVAFTLIWMMIAMYFIKVWRQMYQARL